MTTAATRIILLALALTGLGVTPASAQIRPLAAADPADVATPQAVVDALYETVTRVPGEPWDVSRALSLFLPGAHLIANTEQRGGEFVVHSPVEFWNLVEGSTQVGGPDDKGFEEAELSNVIHRYGDVAQVFSTYRKGWWGEEEDLGRGINAIQLVWHAGRWWVSSIVWDEEVGGGPIPAEDLGESRGEVGQGGR